MKCVAGMQGASVSTLGVASSLSSFHRHPVDARKGSTRSSLSIFASEKVLFLNK